MNGKRIKYFRELRQYKREWLAEKLGLNLTQISRIENNQTKLTVERLDEIAALLEVSIFDLFELDKLKSFDQKKIEKYGPIESNFIRYLINQNELQKAQYDQLLKSHSAALDHFFLISKNLSLLKEFISAVPPKNKKGIKRPN
jgi:transcriptional regulator with XRE-family HTH domain